MKLPKINTPIFTIKIPSTDQEVRYRPFQVREEKILLVAQEGGQDREIILALKQVINNCIIEEGFDVNSLTTFDVEYLFLKMRAKSVNNIVEVKYLDTEDEKEYDFIIDLDNIEITKPEIEKKIQLTETIGIVMKYPSITIVDTIPDDATREQVLDHLVRQCIDYIYDEENVYPMSEVSEAEIVEFIESLDLESYDKISGFFDKLPKLYHALEYTNSKGNKRKIELKSLRDFFTWG